MQLIDRIRDKLESRELRLLAENYFSLAFLQGLDRLIPLITLPYLVRVLKIESYGLVVFANALIMYFVILTDFGFTLFAPREIAVHREDRDKVARIFWDVMFLKGILVLISFGILSLIIFNFDRFREDWPLYMISYGIVLGQAFFPTWFFQGMEKMKYIALLSIAYRLVFAILIFSFVTAPRDLVLVPLFHTLGYLVAGGLSMWIILIKFQIPFRRPEIPSLRDHLKRSFQFFLSRASVSMYTISNTFVVGLFLGPATAGYYAAAEKLYNVMISMYNPLSTVLYPFMSRSADIKLFKRIFTFTTTFNLMACALVFFGSGFIVRLIFGDGFETSASLLMMFAILCTINVPSALLGYPLLAALGHPRYANFSVVVASLIHLGMLAAIIPFIANLKVFVIPVLLIITQLIVLGIRIHGVRKELGAPPRSATCAE
jgi:polysaccharide transporter, PST family